VIAGLLDRPGDWKTAWARAFGAHGRHVASRAVRTPAMHRRGPTGIATRLLFDAAMFSVGFLAAVALFTVTDLIGL
jgi:hypothetical protein